MLSPVTIVQSFARRFGATRRSKWRLAQTVTTLAGFALVAAITAGVSGHQMAGAAASAATSPPSVLSPRRLNFPAQGSKLDAAAAKAASDVAALTAALEKSKADDIAARDAAAKADADFIKARDEASANAAAAKKRFGELYVELVGLESKLSDLAGQLTAAEHTLVTRQATFRTWAIASFIDSGNSRLAETLRPTDLNPRRQRELSEFGGSALKNRRDEAMGFIESIRARQQAAKDRIEAAKIEQKQADKNRVEFELEATTAEEERVIAQGQEYARQQAAEGEHYELALKISQAEAMAQKFTLLHLDDTTLIASQPVLDEFDIARWFHSTGRVARLTVTIDELAADFISEGRAENIRMDIAFAQSILETASFGFPAYGQLKPEDNNYAGIGACDACANGFGFPDALTGVRAQAQLLRVYATSNLTITDFANPSVRWDPAKLGIRGCCTTFSRLAGVWATNTDYFFLIKSVWAGIVDWVADDYLKNGPQGSATAPPVAAGSGASGASGGVGVDVLDGGGD